MPRFLIIIGGRELVIDSDTLENAQATAMGTYPGETITGFGQLPEPEPESGDEDVSSNGD